jgi:phospholipase A2
VTEEDKEFGNFAIFDDPEDPYSSYKFEYEEKHFDRLHELMKYNTLANMDVYQGKDCISNRFQTK